MSFMLICLVRIFSTKDLLEKKKKMNLLVSTAEPLNISCYKSLVAPCLWNCSLFVKKITCFLSQWMMRCFLQKIMCYLLQSLLVSHCKVSLAAKTSHKENFILQQYLLQWTWTISNERQYNTDHFLENVCP